MATTCDEAPLGVKTVVVPAAGMGTRFLPATKTVPKELLPVVDTPGIELIAEEAASLGAARLAIITAPNKQEVMRHFDEFPELVATLQSRGKDEQAAKVERAAKIIKPVSIPQDKPLGLGHAVGLAESVLDDDEDCFAVMLPDDIVMPATVLEDMARVRRELGGSVLCAVEVSREETFNYGVFEVEDTDNDNVKKVVGMVEKPEPRTPRPTSWPPAATCLTARSLMPCARSLRARAASCSLPTPSICSSTPASPSTWSSTTARATISVTRAVTFRHVSILVCVRTNTARRCINHSRLSCFL